MMLNSLARFCTVEINSGKQYFHHQFIIGQFFDSLWFFAEMCFVMFEHEPKFIGGQKKFGYVIKSNQVGRVSGP